MPFFKACGKFLQLAFARKCGVRTHQEVQNGLGKLIDKRCKPDTIVDRQQCSLWHLKSNSRMQEEHEDWTSDSGLFHMLSLSNFCNSHHERQKTGWWTVVSLYGTFLVGKDMMDMLPRVLKKDQMDTYDLRVHGHNHKKVQKESLALADKARKKEVATSVLGNQGARLFQESAWLAAGSKLKASRGWRWVWVTD